MFMRHERQTWRIPAQVSIIIIIIIIIITYSDRRRRRRRRSLNSNIRGRNS